jgi:hypothetical protein
MMQLVYECSSKTIVKCKNGTGKADAVFFVCWRADELGHKGEKNLTTVQMCEKE